MPSPVLPGLLRCVVRYEYAGGVEVANNVLHVMENSLGTWNDAKVTALHNGRIAPWISSCKPFRYSASVATIVSYYDYSATVPVQYERAVTTGAGTDVGQALPLEVAIVASLRTGVAGRRNRGRIYLPHLGSDGLDIVSSQPGFKLADAQSYANATALLCATAAGNDGRVGVYSPTGNAWTAVTQIRVNQDFDTQRRRGQLALPTALAAV